MKLLLAIDDSQYSQEAVKQVAAYFSPQATEIMALHVLTPASYSMPPQMARGYAPEMEALGKEVSSMLEHATQKLRSAGFAVEARVETGECPSTIIDCSADWNADLIVVASHGHRGLERMLLGSVAESVVRHAKCSVLVVRNLISR